LWNMPSVEVDTWQLPLDTVAEIATIRRATSMRPAVHSAGTAR
jgi:hypothetical protein